MTSKKVLLIDSHNLMHRARFGFGSGPHKIYFNFFRMLMGELKNHQPDLVYIVDEGKPVQSIILLDSYKANRTNKPPEDFYREKDEIFETIKQLSGFVYIKHPRYECDDVIGHLATKVHAEDQVVIVSTDSDFIQLISDRVGLWHPKKKKFLEPWHTDYITWKSLKGDSADNVPGVAGVGAKRADVLSASPKALNEFLDAKPERRQQFEVARQVITLKDVEESDLICIQSDFAADSLKEEFTKRNCKSIIGKAWPKWIDQFTAAGGKYAV